MKNSLSSASLTRSARVAAYVVRGALTLALAATVMLIAGACGGSDTTNSSDTGDGTPASGSAPEAPTGTLTVALPGEPQTLDPTRSPENYEVMLDTAVYDGLTTRTSDDFDRLSPALAESWGSNKDATKWTFKLRRGVTFHDGSDFNAAAAKKSLEFYGRETSIYSFAVGDIAKIETPDDYTLVVSYDKPFADLANFMTLVKMISPQLLSGSAEVVEKRVATQAVGTGPFIIDSFSSSRGVTAHANTDYWGDGPYIETLEFRPITEESARNAALQAGEIDLVLGASPRALQTFASDDRLEVATVESWTTNALSLATQQAPLDDVRVRQAFAYAIDPTAIAKNVLLDQATVTGGLMPPGTLGFIEPATQYPYDPEKAKALLTEAGVEQPVRLSMVAYSNMLNGAAIGQALAEQAKTGGFDVRFSVVPAAAGGVDLNKPQRRYNIHLIATGWVNGGPLHFPYILQRSNIKDPTFADLVQRVETTGPGAAREQLIGETIEAAARELPEVPLFAVKVSDAFTSALVGHVPPKDGFLPNWSEQYVEE